MALAYRIAEAADVASLLPMMEAFNAFEAIAWNARDGEPAVRKLVDDRSLGCIGLLLEGDATVGYFVLTWGFDLEWNGRDAFITELFLVESARDRKLGRAAVALAEGAARDHGANALHLMVRHENARAIALYRQAQFTSPGRYFLTKDLRAR